MKQLDPKSVWLFFLGSIVQLFWWCVLFGSIVASIAVVWWADDYPVPVWIGDLLFILGASWWLLIPIVLIVCWTWAQLSYHFYRYELRDEGFRKELGVIWKHYVTIPYDRIQNVDIYRGVVARLLGLSDLNIQTAGVSAEVATGEGRLPGLSHEIAEQLRDELIKRARQSKATSQGL